MVYFVGEKTFFLIAFLHFTEYQTKHVNMTLCQDTIHAQYKTEWLFFVCVRRGQNAELPVTCVPCWSKSVTEPNSRYVGVKMLIYTVLDGV